MKKTTSESIAPELAAPNTANPPGSVKILLATLGAAVIAGLILVTLILPAELNRDPLGVGEALGIKGLSEKPATETVGIEKARFREDTVSFELLPFEFVEYKYRLGQYSALIYSWTATDEVTFDFHGEPAGGPEGFAESFTIGKADHENGAFTAPFTGIHGWFWENRGGGAVTVTLSTAGFYSASLEFRDGFVNEKALVEEESMGSIKPGDEPQR